MTPCYGSKFATPVALAFHSPCALPLNVQPGVSFLFAPELSSRDVLLSFMCLCAHFSSPLASLPVPPQSNIIEPLSRAAVGHAPAKRSSSICLAHDQYKHDMESLLTLAMYSRSFNALNSSDPSQMRRLSILGQCKGAEQVKGEKQGRLTDWACSGTEIRIESNSTLCHRETRTATSLLFFWPTHQQALEHERNRKLNVKCHFRKVGQARKCS